MTTLLLAADHVGRHGHDGPWFPVFPLLFVGLWVLALLTFGRRRFRHAGARSGQAVLGERFARGEIDEAEYRERRRVLRSKD